MEERATPFFICHNSLCSVQTYCTIQRTCMFHEEAIFSFTGHNSWIHHLYRCGVQPEEPAYGRGRSVLCQPHIKHGWGTRHYTARWGIHHITGLILFLLQQTWPVDLVQLCASPPHHSTWTVLCCSCCMWVHLITALRMFLLCRTLLRDLCSCGSQSTSSLHLYSSC